MQYTIQTVQHESDFIKRLPALLTAEISVYPWDSVPHNRAYAVVGASAGGLHVFMRSEEPEIRAEQTEQNGPIYTDSCLEFYLAPCRRSDLYFNVEVNPKGVIYFSVGKDRADRLLITAEGPQHLHMKTDIHPIQYGGIGWTVQYELPFHLIQKYILSFNPAQPLKMRGNFYKCGNELQQPHWGMWAPVETERPDFHRPEYFSCLQVDNEKGK